MRRFHNLATAIQPDTNIFTSSTASADLCHIKMPISTWKWIQICLIFFLSSFSLFSMFYFITQKASFVVAINSFFFLGVTFSSRLTIIVFCFCLSRAQHHTQLGADNFYFQFTALRKNDAFVNGHEIVLRRTHLVGNYFLMTSWHLASVFWRFRGK